MPSDLTGFQRDLLFVVTGLDSPNGQEIKAEMEDSQGRSIQHGRLYKNLDQLVDKGLVEKSKQNGRTNEYGLTDDGSDVVERLHEWQATYLTSDPQ